AELRVLRQQRDEPVDVIRFESGGVVHEQLFVIRIALVGLISAHRSSGAEERRVHRGRRRLQQISALACRPREHVPQDEHHPLPRWERLQRRDERESDGISDRGEDRKSTRLNSSHVSISYAVFCLKKKKKDDKESMKT